jgi:hypothetical protein
LKTFESRSAAAGIRILERSMQSKCFNPMVGG